ncbi:hypothetical protein MJO10_32290, partial [Salmonella enterica subsp. enterica serovar Anatum]|nr:hypothetical protein [Salmonella enterica subsp. enterica serovar Anatum]
TLSGSGDLGQVLVDAIKKYDMDLVVCGHHQDFWSKLMSSARQVPCSVLECEGEPCLFVNRQDEFAATCRLKNFGVAIAEPFSN